jgi:hypothetical protein
MISVRITCPLALWRSMPESPPFKDVIGQIRSESATPVVPTAGAVVSHRRIANPFHRATTTLLVFAIFFPGIWIIDFTCMSLYWVARLAPEWDADRKRVANAPEHSPDRRHEHEQTSKLGSQQRSTEQRQLPIAPSRTSPIPQSELLYWSESIGCGATVKLRSHEICVVSVARSGVLVKSSQSRFIGFFGTVLYNEKNAYKVAETVMALDALFPENSVAATFRNRVLTAYANAIWQCSTAAEVAITLNEAIARAEAQAKSDDKIVCDLADLMASGETKPDAFYDVSVLPHSKEAILLAIEREIRREPLDAGVEWLKVGASFLTLFQEGVGSNPLYLLGVDFAKLQRTTPDVKQQMRIMAENTDGERVRRFQSLMKIDDDRINARIDAAVRSRNARFSAALGNTS